MSSFNDNTITTLKKVRAAAEEIRAHFSQHGSMYDLSGRKAYLRGFIPAFQQHQTPDVSIETLVLLFELALNIDCRE